MNRREVLQRTALTLGYAISAPLAAAVLNGCKAKPDIAFTPKFFNEDQARLISSIAEAILPRTSTPGAIDAGVPGFIDDLVGTVYSAEQQKTFIDGLKAFADEAESEIGDFVDATPEEQLSFVKKKNSEALSGGSGAQSEGWWAAGSGKSKPFFLELKELTMVGFFTSEAGATQVLQYKQVPGPFKGCVPLTEVGKAWAT